MTKRPKAMIVAGVMSGTSADGVDVALCRIGLGARTGDTPRVKLIGMLSTAYPKAVRAAVLRVMEGEALPAAEMSRLNWRLGGIYADCVERAAAKFGVKVALVGCHGQTVHHEAAARRVWGAAVRSTWQMGEAAVIAERMRCPVVSDFRPADLAAGGQGAPLVPMLDWCLFRSTNANRLLLNVGGIANLTVIPAGAALGDVIAFDTGPGNMVIDALMQSEFGKPYDRNGMVAARGAVLGEVFNALWRNPYFAAGPPKSCGREQFGQAYAAALKKLAGKAASADLIATATFLTATSILEAISTFCLPLFARRTKAAMKTELIAAGGGTRNDALMGLLSEGLADLNISLRAPDSLGVPAQAKEGMAFALLAWLTWNGMAGNVPAATGAKHSAILGKVSYG
jgi:anhydro-N-acetylmuramic acid kinase